MHYGFCQRAVFDGILDGEETRHKKIATEIGLNVTIQRLLSPKTANIPYSPIRFAIPLFSKPLATMNEGKVDMKGCDNPKELSEFNARSNKVGDEDYVYQELQKFCDKELRLYLTAFKSPSKLRMKRFSRKPIRNGYTNRTNGI